MCCLKVCPSLPCPIQAQGHHRHYVEIIGISKVLPALLLLLHAAVLEAPSLWQFCSLLAWLCHMCMLPACAPSDRSTSGTCRCNLAQLTAKLLMPVLQHCDQILRAVLSCLDSAGSLTPAQSFAAHGSCKHRCLQGSHAAAQLSLPAVQQV